MNYAKPLNRCAKCIQSNVPAFLYCGTQNWPKDTVGFPYSNTGNNLSGWVQASGQSAYDYLNPQAWTDGTEPFVAVETDGTVLNTIRSFSPSFGYLSWYRIPVTITGDFKLTMDYRINDEGASNGFGLVLSDVDDKRGLYLSGGSPSFGVYEANIDKRCDLKTGEGFDRITSASVDTIPIGDWLPYMVTRIGGVITLTIFGVELVTYDFSRVFGVNLGFTWQGDASFSMRNIVIEQP